MTYVASVDIAGCAAMPPRAPPGVVPETSHEGRTGSTRRRVTGCCRRPDAFDTIGPLTASLNQSPGFAVTTMTRIGIFFAGALLAVPCIAHACACCGIDDWRSVESISRGSHEAGVVSKLRLGPGRFRISDTEEWSISRVERAGDDFVFWSDVGRFDFIPSAQPPEHRRVDITFITQPKYELVDSADIYHELILTGTLRMPDPAVKHFKRESLEVTLVLRGLGNSCFEAGTLQRWQVSSSREPALFMGSGTLVGENQAQQDSTAVARTLRASER